MERWKSQLDHSSKELHYQIEGIRADQSNLRVLLDRNMTSHSDSMAEFRRSIREEAAKDIGNTDVKVTNFRELSLEFREEYGEIYEL